MLSGMYCVYLSNGSSAAEGPVTQRLPQPGLEEGCQLQQAPTDAGAGYAQTKDHRTRAVLAYDS
jgi:hypothetical protein